MKVQVTITVDVDLAAWRAEYDYPDATAAEVRESIMTGVAEVAAHDGILVPAGIIKEVKLVRRDRQF